MNSTREYFDNLKSRSEVIARDKGKLKVKSKLDRHGWMVKVDGHYGSCWTEQVKMSGQVFNMSHVL